jgi:hypothetical protein
MNDFTMGEAPSTCDPCPKCTHYTMPSWEPRGHARSYTARGFSYANARKCANPECGFVEERIDNTRRAALKEIRTELGLAQHVLANRHKASAYMQDWAAKVISKHGMKPQ